MTRRIPVPYHASQAIDAALLAHTSVLRKLDSLLRSVDKTEQQVLILLSMKELHESDKKLREIKRRKPEET